MTKKNVSLSLNVYIFSLLISCVTIKHQSDATNNFFMGIRVNYILSKSWKKFYFYFKSFYRYYAGTTFLKKKWPFFFIKGSCYYSIMQHFFKILQCKILKKCMKNGYVHII